MRDRDPTTVPQTQLAETTVKLNLIHASVDSLNSLNSTNSEKSAPFRENPIAVADLRGGARDARPPSGPKFLYFHAVFGKN